MAASVTMHKVYFISLININILLKFINYNLGEHLNQPV